MLSKSLTYSWHQKSLKFYPNLLHITTLHLHLLNTGRFCDPMELPTVAWRFDHLEPWSDRVVRHPSPPLCWHGAAVKRTCRTSTWGQGRILRPVNQCFFGGMPYNRVKVSKNLAVELAAWCSVHSSRACFMLMYLEIKIKQLPNMMKVIVSRFGSSQTQDGWFFRGSQKTDLSSCLSFSLPVIWAEQCIPAAG